MNISRGLGLAPLIFALHAFAGGQVVTLSEQKTEVVPQCAKEKTCDVRRVGFWTRGYRVDFPPQGGRIEHNYGTGLYAWYETNSLATLRDYVFVQYVRGCVFEMVAKDGKIVVGYPHVRHHFNSKERNLFYHPRWTVDSDDKDPAYNTWIDRPRDRHFYLQWNSTPEQFPRVRGNLHGEVSPSVPRLFVKDLPTQAMAFRSWDGSVDSVNTSLEFHMCLYHEKDVPREIEDGRIIPAEPIACSYWRHSYVYDFAKQVFNSPKEIVPQCVGPTPQKQK